MENDSAKWLIVVSVWKKKEDTNDPEWIITVE